MVKRTWSSCGPFAPGGQPPPFVTKRGCGPPKPMLVAAASTRASRSMERQSGRSSGVEHNLAKVGVEGSNPFARSSSLLLISSANQQIAANRPAVAKPPTDDAASPRRWTFFPVRAELVEALPFFGVREEEEGQPPSTACLRQSLRTGFDKLRANGGDLGASASSQPRHRRRIRPVEERRQRRFHPRSAPCRREQRQ